MLFWGVQKAIDGLMGAAWKTGRNTIEGVRGTTKYVNSAGEQVALNPARKLARRLKNDAKGVFTGNEYNLKNEVVGRRNRMTSGLHFIGDATFGTAGTALGWVGRGVGVAGMAPIKLGAKPAAKFAGHFTKQGLDYVGDTAMGAADLVMALNKSPIGREALFAGGAIGTMAIGGGKALSDQWSSDAIGKAGLQFYNGQQIESLPGTISPSSIGVENGQLVQEPLDNLGADGDLVFAMHNMR